MTSKSSKIEKDNRLRLLQEYSNSPIPKDELINNLSLYLKRQHITDILVNDFLYNMILDVPGVIIELGCRWGQRISQFISLRGIYEPYNFNRRIIGFDTFEGFPDVSNLDGNYHRVYKGSYNVTSGYDEYLTEILKLIESECPISHIKKFELVRGDVNTTLLEYFEENPETIVSLVYFDLDLYKPTKKCLEVLVNYLSKGTILAFDQFNHPSFPGETLALKEVFDISQLNLKQTRVGHVTYFQL